MNSSIAANRDEKPEKPLRIGLIAPLFVFLGAFAVLLFSVHRLPVTWDEGEMDDRSDWAVHWIMHVTAQIPGIRAMIPLETVPEHVRQEETLEMLLSPWGMTTFWTGTVSVEGHPQWPVILAALGKIVAPSFLPDIVRLRFGPILFFSLVFAVVFYRLRAEFGSAAAWFGAVSILSIPRLFAHAQIAAWDSTLTASWMLSWALFSCALRSQAGAVLFGGAVGLTVASKFPGVAVIIPPLLWLGLRILSGDRTCSFASSPDPKTSDPPHNGFFLLKQGLVATLIALLVFLLANPPLWFDPIGGIKTYCQLNMNRSLNVAILFFGRMYDLYHSLPWYNTLLWTAITVPLGLLILSLIGMVAVARSTRYRWPGLLILLNMALPLLMRALPDTPVHDGVRLFVTAYAFLGMMAGIGAAACWKISRPSRIGTTLRRGLVCGAYAFCLLNMFWYAPQWLSYYNVVIGGLPGAVQRGMEPTYYWDSFDREVVDWLREHTEPGEQVAFSITTSLMLDLSCRSQSPPLPFEMVAAPISADRLAEDGFRYYVLQRRPSAEFRRDRFLIENKTPVFRKTIRKGGIGPWNLGSTPLLEIYSADR